MDNTVGAISWACSQVRREYQRAVGYGSDRIITRQWDLPHCIGKVMLMESPSFHILRSASQEPASAEPSGGRPFTLTATAPAQPGIRTCTVRIAGREHRILRVVPCSCGNCVICSMPNPSSFQSRVEARNWLTKTSPSRWKKIVSVNLANSSTPVPVQHQKDSSGEL